MRTRAWLQLARSSLQPPLAPRLGPTRRWMTITGCRLAACRRTCVTPRWPPCGGSSLRRQTPPPVRCWKTEAQPRWNASYAHVISTLRLRRRFFWNTARGAKASGGASTVRLCRSGSMTSKKSCSKR